MHPGIVKTDLPRYSYFTELNYVRLHTDLSSDTNLWQKILAIPVERGALTLLYAAADPEAANHNGKVQFILVMHEGLFG